MNYQVLVHQCYKEMRKLSPEASKSHVTADVADHMRLSYEVVERLIDEPVLEQLTLF